MKFELTLEGKGVYLRRLELVDASSSYLGWLQDSQVNSFLEVRFNPPESLNDLEAFIRNSNDDPDTLLLGIFLRDGDKHIGNIKLGPINRAHRVGDLGFLIGDKEQWGKGFATEAISLLADYGLARLGLAKITAGCYEENFGPRNALLKAGFKEEGRLLSHWEVDGSRQAGYLFGRCAEV